MRAPDRPTPFALGLPGEGWMEDRFPALAREAEARGKDPRDPAAFLLLAGVGAALQDLRGEGDASPESFHAFGRFLFHAFHLWGAGREGSAGVLLEVDAAAARGLVEGDAGGGVTSGWGGELPAGAGYLRLPRNLFWTRPGGEEDPAEALDGVAWVEARSGGGVRELALLALSGVIEGRAGFTVLPLSPHPLDRAREWLDAPSEREGRDFAPTLPGGELGGLHSVETLGELLKLVGRALAWGVVPDAVVESGDAAREEASSEAGARGGAQPGVGPDRHLRRLRLVLPETKESTDAP